MTYVVKNTSSSGKSYDAGDGNRIHFEPGEEKEVDEKPPEVEDLRKNYSGWDVEKEQKSKSGEDEEEVNE